MVHQAKNIVIFSAKNDVVSINQRNMDSLFYWIKAMSMQIENPTLPSRKDDMRACSQKISEYMSEM